MVDLLLHKISITSIPEQSRRSMLTVARYGTGQPVLRSGTSLRPETAGLHLRGVAPSSLTGTGLLYETCRSPRHPFSQLPMADFIWNRAGCRIPLHLFSVLTKMAP